MTDMVIDMNESRLNTVAQLSAFLNGTLEVNFCAPAGDCERYAFIGTVLERHASESDAASDARRVRRAAA
jgi:hypothetical protein